ncbi:MAG: Mediator of RNA polymerase II transcription subunit 6 [Watsoniomyces obsoletus]|nr:MAG: Mediator of RNA polymerase II transcription subunit 6 [Watsoniomyces obsoletus]
MFRNNYDNDSVTFSPQGRIFQVEYASEAVKQGSVVVGLVSKTHAVLVALKRNAEELSSYQKKVIGIDDHLGIALAGLASDARVLSNFMKQQSLASKMTYGRPIPLQRIVTQIGERAQTNTQHYGKRPYGVGLLIAGVDDEGPHLFEFQPSGMTQEMVACAIGARSQMARTYLERHLDEFANASREELMRHGLKALKESLAQDKELTVENTSVAVIGIKSAENKKGERFRLFEGQETTALLEGLSEPRDADASETTQVDDSGAMDVDT